MLLQLKKKQFHSVAAPAAEVVDCLEKKKNGH